MKVVHLTAKMIPGGPRLCDGEIAGWFWGRLRAAFPWALAGILMPDHPHVVAWVQCIERAHARFTRVLGALRAHLRSARPIWYPAPEARVISGRDKLRRNVRYTALNPNRAGLARDPLEWLWSTHRDVIGAASDPWVTSDALARWLGPGTDPVAWHRYVSSDSTCHVAGTPPATPAPPSDYPAESIEHIAAAAVAATRSTPDQLHRRGPTRTTFLLLAQHQGWRTTKSPRPPLLHVPPRSPRRLRPPSPRPPRTRPSLPRRRTPASRPNRRKAAVRARRDATLGVNRGNSAVHPGASSSTRCITT